MGERCRRPSLTAALCCAPLALSACGGGHDAEVSPAPSPQPAGGAPSAARRPALCGRIAVRVTGHVAAPAATELSGLVASRTQPRVLWTHNDSGDTPRVLAISPSGRLLAEVTLSGAQAVDWEDIAAGPDVLLLGDIGDNLAQRDSVSVYRIAEPPVASGSRGVTATSSAAAGRLELRYPDGPRDAEALLRDPGSGALVIVEKRADGRSGVYVAPHFEAGASITLRRAGRLRLGAGELVTAGDVSADGMTIALRTYSRTFVWRRRAGESVAATLLKDPCTVRANMTLEGQSESIALSRDGRSFYTVPEGSNPALRRYAPVG